MKISGPTKSWAGVGSSGKPVHRIFCGECGSPIAHDPEAAPPIIAIKAGTLSKEIKQTLKPVCFAYQRSSSLPLSRRRARKETESHGSIQFVWLLT